MSAYLAKAVCDRCKMAFNYDALSKDPNFEGLRVCADCLDEYDPYRLPMRQPEEIALDEPRPEVALAAVRATYYETLGGRFNEYLVSDNRTNVTVDLDVRIKVAVDWTITTGPNYVFMSKYQGKTPVSWDFEMTSASQLRFWWNNTGHWSGDIAAFSSVNVTAVRSLQAWDAIWVRVTQDVDNGSGGADTKFYTSLDGISWSQLGSTITDIFTSSIYPSSAPYAINAWMFDPATESPPYSGGIEGYGSNHKIRVYRTEVRDGINGSLVSHFNAEDTTDGMPKVTSSVTGETWSIVGEHSRFTYDGTP